MSETATPSRSASTPVERGAPVVRLPIVGLIVAGIAAGAAGMFAGALLTEALGWGTIAESLRPAGFGGGVVAVVGVLVAVFMAISTSGASGARAQAALNQAVLGSTGIRLLGVLFVGLGVSLLIDNDRPMWLGLLAAGMLALVADTFLLTRALNRIEAGQRQ